MTDFESGAGEGSSEFFAKYCQFSGSIRRVFFKILPDSESLSKQRRQVRAFTRASRKHETASSLSESIYIADILEGVERDDMLKERMAAAVGSPTGIQMTRTDAARAFLKSNNAVLEACKVVLTAMQNTFVDGHLVVDAVVDPTDGSQILSMELRVPMPDAEALQLRRKMMRSGLGNCFEECRSKIAVSVLGR